MSSLCTYFRLNAFARSPLTASLYEWEPNENKKKKHNTPKIRIKLRHFVLKSSKQFIVIVEDFIRWRTYRASIKSPSPVMRDWRYRYTHLNWGRILETALSSPGIRPSPRKWPLSSSAIGRKCTLLRSRKSSPPRGRILQCKLCGDEEVSNAVREWRHLPISRSLGMAEMRIVRPQRPVVGAGEIMAALSWRIFAQSEAITIPRRLW